MWLFIARDKPFCKWTRDTNYREEEQQQQQQEAAAAT
jgi:hypothetical protein